MNPYLNARTSEALIKAMSHAEVRHPGPDDLGRRLPAMTIAISRQAGAQGTSLARELGRRLGWPVYDHELLERMAEEMNVHVRLLESIDERHVPWLVEAMERFSSIPYVSENTFVRRLIETVLSLGARGRCIIVGRGSPHILPPATTLRLRLFADLELRVETIMHELHLSQAEAQDRVKAIDRERTAFLKDHFHIDPNHPSHYDLQLNVSRLPLDCCADLALAALHAREQARRTAHPEPHAV